MRLNGIAFGAAVISFGWLPQSALAADVSVPVYPTTTHAHLASPGYDWSGHYIGALVGYGSSRTAVGDVTFYQPADNPVGGVPGFEFPGNGWLGGAEIGHGWQSGSMYLGAAADIAAANITGTFVDDVNGFMVDGKINWLATARLSLGVAVDRALLYATGGLAVGGVEAILNDDYGDDTITSTSSGTGVGWTVGGGVALALHDRWVVKAEYLYVDLGTQSHSFTQESPPGWPLITTSAKTTANVVRLGLGTQF